MTVNEFIKRLQQIHPNKRDKEVVVLTPNGMLVEPVIKQLWDNDADILHTDNDKFLLTYKEY